jgi:CheY-like chemotaxis protein
MLYTFTIKDNGIGMSEEFLKKIFSPFERERTSTASHQQGTGLGMAIVKNLVERINGQIHIESKQGEGTTTTVILPLKIADEELVKENASKQGAEALLTGGNASSGAMTLEGKRILLVDDMDINREIATVILKEQKIVVTPAEDGQQAIEIFKDNPAGFDAILMDVQMPVMDGYDATREIRKLDIPEAKTVPIVAMTANAFAEDRARAIESGMNDHISKPIDVSQLFRILMKYTL